MRGIYDGLQADLELIKKLYLQRDYSRKMMCFYCGALQWVYTGWDPEGLPNDPALLYTNFGEQALHRTPREGARALPPSEAYLLPAAHFAAQATYGEDDEEWEDMDDEMLAEQEEEESRAKDHEFEARMPEEPQKSVCYKVKQTATRKGTRLVSRPEEFATPTG
ncbi:RH16, partial [Symbiodinium sp. KB8]